MANIGIAIIDEVEIQTIDENPTRVQFWCNTLLYGDRSPPQAVIDTIIETLS